MNKKILLCEDDQAIQEIVTLVLKEKGYEIIVDGGDFDSILSANPNLILLDLGLEKGSGIELAQKIRTHEKTRELPLIIVSGSATIDQAALEVGAHDFLKKPFNIRDLENIVEKYLPQE